MKKKQTITPLGNRVLVKREEVSHEKTVSGIIIPESSHNEKSHLGVVIATGEGRVTDDGNTIPLLVKEGDTILFSPFGTDEIEHNGETYLIVGESNILAIIT